MKNVIQEIRTRLAPFVGKEQDCSSLHSYVEEPISRFVRKVPKKNYEDLPRLIPISWL